MRIATEGRMAMSSVVHPSRWISAACPAITPPAGMVMAAVMPFARVTGMCSLAGLIATPMRNCGLNTPSSVVSFISRTEPISVAPSCPPESIRPG